jgi:hypothetical protein
MNTGFQNFWQQVQGPALLQGDLLEEVRVPVLSPQVDAASLNDEIDAELDVRRVVIVTQSCDLENDKSPFVAICRVYTLDEFEGANPSFRNRWEDVRQGKLFGLHLLGSPVAPADNRGCYVVDFRDVSSVPIKYLKARAQSMGPRWRLQSPFLEHFSQAFARFFMRVGLPSSIPPFKK